MQCRFFLLSLSPWALYRTNYLKHLFYIPQFTGRSICCVQGTVTGVRSHSAAPSATAWRIGGELVKALDPLAPAVGRLGDRVAGARTSAPVL